MITNPLASAQRHRRSIAVQKAGLVEVEIPAVPKEPFAESKVGQRAEVKKQREPIHSALHALGHALQRTRTQHEGEHTRIPLSGREGARSLPKGVPVPALLQHIYVMNRDRNLVTSCGFLVYLVMLFTLMASIYDVHEAYGVNAAVSDLFLDEEFPGAQYKKNFFEIMTFEEWWTWLEGPVIAGAYPTEWYNEQPLTAVESGKVLYTLRRVGGVQLRQLRVRSDSCTLSSQTKLTGGTACYAAFSAEAEDRAPFGPGGAFKWSDGYHPMTGLFGYGPSGGYGTGGYVVVLNATSSETAAAQVSVLKAAKWLDEGTRAVAVMFNLYNANTRTLTVVRLLTEFFNNGHIVKSYKFHSMRQEVYFSTADFFRAGLECVFGFMFLVHLGATAWGLMRSGPMHLSRLSTIYEVTMHVLMIVVLIEWLTYLTDPERLGFDASSHEFTDLYALSQQYIETFTLASFIVLMYCLNFFRFFSINKRLNTLWLTLYRAAPDLAGFTLGFIILVSGFAVLAQYTYGSLLGDFHNFTSSFSTLLRFPLGDFSYEALSNTRPQVTGLFFACYVAMVFLVCMNMIIGIISLYFEEVHAALKAEDAWMRSAASLDVAIRQRIVLSLHKVLALLRLVGAPGRQLKALLLEDAFRAQLHKCIGLAKRHAEVELQTYLSSVYNRADPNESVYVGMHELCKLTSSRGVQDAAECYHNDCAARHLLLAYNEMTKTTLVGKVRRNDGFKHLVDPIKGHTPEGNSCSRLMAWCKGAPGRSGGDETALDSTVRKRSRRLTTTDAMSPKHEHAELQDTRSRFYVRKVSTRGWHQGRLLFLDARDPADPQVQLYDVQGRLRKEYPLHLLSQVDESRVDECAIILHFHASSAVGEGAGGEDADHAPVPHAHLTSPRASTPSIGNKEEAKHGTSATGTARLHLVFEVPSHRRAFAAQLFEAVDLRHADVSRRSAVRRRTAATVASRAGSPERAPSLGGVGASHVSRRSSVRRASSTSAASGPSRGVRVLQGALKSGGLDSLRRAAQAPRAETSRSPSPTRATSAPVPGAADSSAVQALTVKVQGLEETLAQQTQLLHVVLARLPSA